MTHASTNRIAAAIVLLATLQLSAQGEDQTTSPVVTITVDGARYLGQTSVGEVLRLTPDACYFNGKRMTAGGQGLATPPSPELNGGKSFSEVRGLKSPNSLSWFAHIPSPGPVEVQFRGVTGSSLRFEIGDQAGLLRTVDPAPGQVDIARAGVYRVTLFGNRGESILREVVLRGPSLRGASLLRSRWRPKAAHARFTASTLRTPTLVWVMEMDAAPGRASFYSPMTTPFGYFGASWTTEGVPSGLNFSMWSYGRGQKEPAIEKLSYLLAIGDPAAKFGGFGHEGTGVKPRGWNPFQNWNAQRCVFAIRMEPGETHDTFYGYYYQPDPGRWRLYASGRKARKRPGVRRKPASLFAGSFVEVPGPSHRQRSGHIPRKMRYRGFTLDSDGVWHAFDQMRGQGKPGELTNRGREVDADGRFALWTGGMQHFGPNAPQRLSKPSRPEQYAWMEPSRLRALMTVPTTIKLESLTHSGGVASLRLAAKGVPEGATTTVYYGPARGLTFADRWAHRYRYEGLKEGSQTIRFACRVAPLAARVLVQHPGGQYWSDNFAQPNRP